MMVSEMKRSVFSSIPPYGGTEPFLALRQEFAQDNHPEKVNMILGAYRDEEGQPYVLPVVASVERAMGIAMGVDETLNHEYLPIEGLKEMCQAATKLALGCDEKAITENRVCALQSLSGTGALLVALTVLNKFHASKCIYLSKPSWVSHERLCRFVGYEDVREYRYYDFKTNTLNIEGMLNDLQNAPNGSIVILHACGHNPTGVDASHEEWIKIADVMQEKGHFPLFDVAYQGIVSGDPDVDAWAVRHFVSRGFELFGASSFSKIFGIYNERAGNLFCVCINSQVAKNIHSQMILISRAIFHSLPNHGAKIVATILNNPKLTAEWKVQLRGMADRIRSARTLLHQKLKELGTPGDWSHIINHCGLFSFIGLSPRQVEVLKKKHHIYLSNNGRFVICKISTKNVDHISKAIDDVVRNVND